MTRYRRSSRDNGSLTRPRALGQPTLERAGKELAGLPDSGEKHTKQAVSHPVLGQYLKGDCHGRFVLDRRKVNAGGRLLPGGHQR